MSIKNHAPVTNTEEEYPEVVPVLPDANIAQPTAPTLLKLYAEINRFIGAQEREQTGISDAILGIYRLFGFDAEFVNGSLSLKYRG